MASLLRPQALLAPTMRACPQRCAFTSVNPTFAVSRPVLQRGALVIRAAEDKDKKVLKKLPSPEKQALLAEERRVMNKARKSACATRIKKVIKMAETLISTPPKSEEEVKPLEKLISEAYTEIDKAVVKGVLHDNTAARKKARVARYKRQVLMVAGLYKPAPESPHFARYEKLQAKKAVAA